jgi:hypothetical protein
MIIVVSKKCSETPAKISLFLFLEKCRRQFQSTRPLVNKKLPKIWLFKIELQCKGKFVTMKNQKLLDSLLFLQIYWIYSIFLQPVEW